MSDRTSVLFDPGDLSAPPGSHPWAIAVHLRAKGALNDANTSRESVDCWVNALHKEDRFRVLVDSKGRNYRSWSSFCKDRQPFGLGYSEAAINAILAEREARDAKKRGQDAALATTGEVLPRGNPTGANQHQTRAEAKEERSKLDISSQSKRAEENGVSRYTQIKLDRLASDFPGLHERVKAGELSVNAAALEAGLVAPTMTIPLDPAKAARRIAKRFSRPDRAALAAAILAELSTAEGGGK